MQLFHKQQQRLGLRPSKIETIPKKSWRNGLTRYAFSMVLPLLSLSCGSEEARQWANITCPNAPGPISIYSDLEAKVKQEFMDFCSEHFVEKKDGFLEPVLYPLSTEGGAKQLSAAFKTIEGNTIAVSINNDPKGGFSVDIGCGPDSYSLNVPADEAVWIRLGRIEDKKEYPYVSLFIEKTRPSSDGTAEVLTSACVSDTE